jgi:hypothetical protein
VVRRAVWTLFLCISLVVAGCGGDNSPTSPSPSPSAAPAAAPAPTLYTIQGTVRSASGQALAGATVLVIDGPNGGKSVTSDGGGSYQLTGLTYAGFTVEVSAPAT